MVVMDAAGHRTSGKLSNVSPRSFEVVTKKGQTQTFGEGKLTAFWKVDYRPTPVKKTTIYVAPLADARRRGVSLSIRY